MSQSIENHHQTTQKGSLGLEQRPLLAFAVCYVTAHYVLDLIDEQEASVALDYCEEIME